MSSKVTKDYNSVPDNRPFGPEMHSVIVLRDTACVGGAIASLGMLASAGVEIASHAAHNQPVEQIAHIGLAASGVGVALSIALGAVSAVVKQRTQ